MTKQAAEVIEIGQKQVVKYDIADKGIDAMREKYTGLTVIEGDTASYKAMAEAISDVRGHRVSIEKRRKELKADALKWGRTVDTEAKRLTSLLTPIEDELKAAKQVEDDRKDAIRLEKERQEQARIEGIRQKISDIQKIAGNLVGMDADSLNLLFAETDAMVLGDDYAEFGPEAISAKADAVNALTVAIEARERQDREDAERKAESERLEKLRLEQEATQKQFEAEQARIREAQEAEAKRLKMIQEEQELRDCAAREKVEFERRAIEDEKAKFEAKKQAESDRKDREEFERQAREDAKIQAEKDAKEKIIHDAIEAQRREEAEATEDARQEALKPDKDKVKVWATEIGALSAKAPDLSDRMMGEAVSDARVSLTENADILNDLVESL